MDCIDVTYETLEAGIMAECKCQLARKILEQMPSYLVDDILKLLFDISLQMPAQEGEDDAE